MCAIAFKGLQLIMADLLTTRQVQEILRVDRTTIYRMVEGGQLPGIRVGKQWRFARTDLDRWLQTQAAQPGVTATAKSTLETLPRQTAQHPVPAANALLPLPYVQMLQDAFAEALGVTLVVTDMAGHPLTHVSNPCGLYAFVLRDDEAVTRCILDWQRIAGVIPLEPKFSPNDLGVLCARGLIRVGNELKGMVFCGGIAPDQWPPAVDQVASTATHFGVPPEMLGNHIAETHYLDRRQRDHVLSFVQRIADLISQLLEDRKSLVSGS
jgi:excisionase family DNA binding protein